MRSSDLTPKIILAILVAALGYFVDAYDIMLFSVVRTQSLQALGIPPSDLLNVGVDLLNWQLVGLLLGGIFWGILGDKRGRMSVLFGSILLYSLANIANGFVQSVEVYRWLRFVTGIGLAGELGAGITLVSEIMSKESRGWATTVIATSGVLGVVAASLVGLKFTWQTAFFVGGGMGLVLLCLRLGVYESGMFKALLKKRAPRGDFLALFRSWERFVKYFSSVLVALPVWYVVGILVTFSPEIGKSMGMAEPPNTQQAIFYAYLGLTTGDMTSGTLSQLFRNRKKIILAFLILTSFYIVVFYFFAGISPTIFYGLCAALGFGVGYWAVFVVAASEQFGTNIRATVATTAPNFVRGSAVLLTLAFKALTPHFGPVQAAALVGIATMALSFVALWNLEETYGKNLDYIESI